MKGLPPGVWEAAIKDVLHGYASTGSLLCWSCLVSLCSAFWLLLMDPKAAAKPAGITTPSAQACILRQHSNNAKGSTEVVHCTVQFGGSLGGNVRARGRGTHGGQGWQGMTDCYG